MPFISFIVPVYNIRKYLPACVESIISQPCNDWEIILVDDNSNDGSGPLCDQYATQDKRIKVIHLAANKGPGSARNEGIVQAYGDYVFFLDGDDTIAHGELPHLREHIVKCGFPDMMRVGYSESFGRTPPANTTELQEVSKSVCTAEDFLLPLLRKSRVGFRAWEFVIKRSLLLDFGLRFGSARIWEDNDFTMRCIFSSGSIGEYKRVFYYWRIRLSDSLTSAHALLWGQIVKSATDMLEFACNNSLPDLYKEWALHSVNSCILEFEAAAGAISISEISRHTDLFLPIQNNLHALEKYIIENGLLWYIRTMGVQQGVVNFCKQKAKEICSLLNGRTGYDIFGFPATRKSARILSILSANGYECKGMLDNNPQKQGLMLDRRVIFSPEIIPLCYDDNSKLFIIVATATKSTGKALSDQLHSYGLEEGRHFICARFEDD